MVERAAHLAKLFPAAFVVMGHTHIPVSVPAGEATTYINIGSWAEEIDENALALALAPEAPRPVIDLAYRAARTHLVIHMRDRAVAHFCTWEDNGHQPVQKLTADSYRRSRGYAPEVRMRVHSVAVVCSVSSPRAAHRSG